MRVSNFAFFCLLFMIQCNSNFEYRISKISNEQCNIYRSWSKHVSTAISFSYKLRGAPTRGHHVYKEIWRPQKDDILYCKKEYCSEMWGIDKHAVGI